MLYIIMYSASEIYVRAHTQSHIYAYNNEMHKKFI